MISPDITDREVFIALRKFIMSFVDCPVIRSQVNDVPMPQGSFVAMNSVGKRALSTNRHEYPKEGEKTVHTSTEYRIQVDFYGADSWEMCQTFLQLIQDEYGFYAFPKNIKPLYASDPQQIPFIAGEKDYIERWTTEVFLQINPTVTTPVAMIDELPVFPILANGL